MVPAPREVHKPQLDAGIEVVSPIIGHGANEVEIESRRM